MSEQIEIQERRRGSRCCESEVTPRLTTEEAQALSDDLQILAHPVRLQILSIIARNEGHICVCDLEGALPVKQPTISHHLKLLRDAGLIDCERQGLWAYYFVRPEALTRLRENVQQQLEALL